MSSMLKTIADLLTTESYVYIGERPLDSPDECSVIKQIQGRPSQHVFDQQTAIFRQPTIVITIRDSDFEDGYSRCEDIVGSLDGLTSSGITMMLESDIITLGSDEKNRPEFMMIYRILLI